MPPGRPRPAKRSTPAPSWAIRSAAPWRWPNSRKSGPGALCNAAPASAGSCFRSSPNSPLAASALRLSARGVGLLAGLEVRAADGSPATAAALGLLKTMLHRGFILLPEGEHANVLGFTPPLTISERALRRR